MNKLLIACLLVAYSSSAQTVTLQSELQTFRSIALLPSYRSHTVEAQVSTYDTTGGNNDGFGGEYSFVKRNPDSSLVIFDATGPGVINRIWTPTPTKDTLDFFIDDLTRPALSVCYMDLFSGKVFPFVQPLSNDAVGGYFCYFPFIYQKQCRIVCRGKKLEFHQIGYRTFPKGTKVESYRGVTPSARQLLKEIAALYNEPSKSASSFAGQRSTAVTINTLISPGETKKIFSRQTGGRIEGIELSPDVTPDSSLYLRIDWDGDKRPAVYCPLIDLFGYAFGKPSMRSLLVGTEGRKHYFYFPMPFDNSAAISLEYKQTNDAHPVRFTGTIYVGNNKRDVKNEGKFVARYNKNELFPGDPMHTYLDTTGKGHYVGNILQAQGFTPGSTPFFEGDDSCATDGVMRMHGTGSEDSFNGGWYDLKGRWDTTRSLPLSGCLLYSKNQSRTGGYRFFINDKIPFEKHIFSGIEHGPQFPGEHVVYTSLALFYYDPNAESMLKDLTP